MPVGLCGSRSAPPALASRRRGRGTRATAASTRSGCFARSPMRRDAELRGLRRRHRQRIGVLETERHADAEADGGQFARIVARSVGCGCFRISASIVPQVFGVDIDRARLQRLEHDRGVAEPRLVLRLRVARRRLRDDLAEDVRLGEAFGSDHQRAIGRAGSAADQQRDDQAQASRRHRALHQRNADSARRTGQGWYARSLNSARPIARTSN